MVTIQNNTGKVVVVYNENFNRHIPIDQSVELTPQEIDDCNIKIKYYNVNQKDGWNFDVKKSFTGKSRPYLFHQTNIHLISVFRIHDGCSVVLKKNDLPLPSVVLFLKRVVISTISFEINEKNYNPFSFLFVSNIDRKKLLWLLRLELLFMIPIMILFLSTIIPIFLDDCELGFKITDFVITALATYIGSVDIYYYISARKWNVDLNDCRHNESISHN